MKLKRTLCAVLSVAALTALTACSGSGLDLSALNGLDSGSGASEEGVTAEDGYGEGRIGDTMQTYFFDYTVNSAYTCTEFGGTTPAEGNVFLVADVTVHNTNSASIEMYDTDFQAQWGSEAEEDFRVPITYDTENLVDLPTLTDDQLPSTYTLAVDEERTGLLVYEVPSGYQDFSISYQEMFSDETTGDTFFVFFTADPQEGGSGTSAV